jgi:SAM-dependent methyltransferase
MKAALLLFVSILFFAAADPGLTQGLRGSGGRGTGGWTRSPGFAGRQPFQGTIGVAPGVISQSPHIFPRRSGGGFGFYYGSPYRAFGFARAPFAHPFAPLRFSPVRNYDPYYNSFYYYPYYYPRYIGPLAFDAGGYGGSAPYAPYMPDAVYPNQPGSEDASSRFPGREPGHIAPFDPTPLEIVERMLTLARVNSDDVLYDLGSGDGRVAIAAAKKNGAKAVGFELDAGLVKLSRENAQKEGVGHLVEFRQMDFLTADLSGATVVTLYLSYDGNLTVRPHLIQQLKPGARVVSYTFDMGDWSPRIAESYRDNSGNTHMLYFWEISGPQAVSDSR